MQRTWPRFGRRGYHYLVAGRQPERNAWLDDFEAEDNWEKMIRTPSPRNPGQEKSQVQIKRRQKGKEVYLLCLQRGTPGEGPGDSGNAGEAPEEGLGEAENARVEKGQLKKVKKIYQAIGRLQERYPRVARYYRLDYEAEQKVLTRQEDRAKKALAAKLDGGYVLKTDHQDLTADEIWRAYILLTRVEAAFRAMKSPLAERPLFHHLRTSHPNAYLPLRPGLPSAGGHRETVPGRGHAHLVVDAAPATQHPPSGHRGVAHRRRQGLEDSQRHHAGTGPPPHLLDFEDPLGGNEAG